MNERNRDIQVNPTTRVTKTQEMVYEMRVHDVMTRNVITVSPNDPMSGLRDILHRNRISGLPVVDKDRLVGLISLEDFIKWLADRQDDCPIRDRTYWRHPRPSTEKATAPVNIRCATSRMQDRCGASVCRTSPSGADHHRKNMPKLHRSISQ